MSRFFGGRKLRPLLSKKHKDLRFAFDRVFDETSSQAQLFKNTTHPIIEGVLDGINCSVFAYGATGKEGEGEEEEGEREGEYYGATGKEGGEELGVLWGHR